MIYKEIYLLPEFKDYNISQFGYILELGYLLNYSKSTNLVITSLNSFKEVASKNLEGQNSFYWFVNRKLLISIDNVLYESDFCLQNFNKICSSTTLRINSLNELYSLGVTYVRKPREIRNEIIKNINSEIVYIWNNRDTLKIIIDRDLFLFENYEKGTLYFMNLEHNEIMWEPLLNSSKPTYKLMELIDNRSIITTYNVNGKCYLSKIDFRRKSIEFALENVFSFYNYDKTNNKLYGLGANKFEVINAGNGEKELITEIKENIFVTPELTFLDKESLYFSSYLNHNIPVLGSVNINTGTLEFLQEVNLPGEKSFRKGLERPYVVDNRLYVRDTLKTLHIFERNN